MNRFGANNAVEIITFVVLAVIWAAVQLLNRSARRTPAPPREPQSPRPDPPVERAEDELRRFFEQLARTAEGEKPRADPPVASPSTTRPAPAQRTYTTPPLPPPPIPAQAAPPAFAEARSQQRPVFPGPPIGHAQAPAIRKSRPRAPIPFTRDPIHAQPRQIEAFDLAEEASISHSIGRRLHAGTSIRSATIPLRSGMPALPSLHLRTSPTGGRAGQRSRVTSLLPPGNRRAMRRAIILRTILGPPRALAPAGNDLQGGD